MGDADRTYTHARVWRMDHHGRPDRDRRGWGGVHGATTQSHQTNCG
jgi:hypothetical protein